ncbi:glycosyltransferase family 2 protein [Eggerthellaceae bacterium 3-80]
MKFSIIVAAYNVEAYIGECLQALKRQTFANFEVLVVDDASTDETRQRARAAIGDDPRFRLIELPHNSGLSAVRNVGLSQVRGDYVLFLDSDDYYVDDALARIAARADEDDLDLLFFGAKTFYENARLRRERYEDQESRVDIVGVHSGPEFYVLFEETKSFRPSACLFAVRRQLLEQAQLTFLEGIIHEDLLFLMQLIVAPKRVGFLKEPLYMRRMREGSIMTQRFSMRNVDGLFRVAQTMRAWLYEHGQEYSQAFCDAFCARTFDTYHVAARYLFEIDEADVDAYRDKLSFAERLDFDLFIGEVFKRVRGVYDEMTGSRTYRLGRLFLAGPSWIKSRLVPPGK